MKHHEREYFISKLRMGIYYVNIDGKVLTIKTPSIEDEYFINKRFRDDYNRCIEEGIKTEDEMLEWMRERGLWTQEDDKKESGIKKDIENTKKELFINRHRTNIREGARVVIRAGQNQLTKVLQKKTKFYGNTCEGIANIGKVEEFLKRCTYYNDNLCNIEEFKIETLSSKYYKSLHEEKIIRELSRSEPWRSLWTLRDSSGYQLFNNTDRELSPDQRNILVWSRMYDNVHESPDCPSNEVIEDDEMLDGWFLIQSDKRKDSIMESELENKLSNQKIANSPEVFLMADNQEDAIRIDSMNSQHARTIKRQRFNQIKQQGKVDSGQLGDERLEMNRISNQQYRDKFRR